MAEMKRTPQQQLAVDCEGGALLVSAAAGSGKTKVLVDRVLRKLCDPSHPQNINDFLIITYTRAAASELRGKLAAAIGKELARQPGNRHLQRQLSRIYLAQISTVHAFCTEIIRDYAHELELYPDFRVAEERECAQWQEQAMEETLEQAYRTLDEHPEEQAFLDLLGAGRDDRAAPAILMQAYHSVQCHPDPEGWIDRCLAQLDAGQYADAAQTPWGALLLEDFQQFLDEQQLLLQRALELAQSEPVTADKYAPVLAQNLEQLRALRALDTWDALHNAPVESFGTLGRVTKFDDKEFLERIKRARKSCWEQLQKKQAVFSASSAEALAELAQTAQAIRGMFSLVRRFSEAYRAVKQRRRALDFGDLEHEALRLLRRRDGSPTPQAREIAGRYAEIMVDEYQDTNAVQDTIFRLVSRAGQNLFLVGDVKQSIYRFRLADPGIFLQKYRSFGPAEQAQPGEGRHVLLSKNFRSQPEILQAVNDICSLCMSEAVGDLRYGPDEALYPGLAPAPLPQPRVELHCIETGDGEQSKRQVESEFVAARIARLLRQPCLTGPDGALRPARPEDIVILLRSPRSQAGFYAAALRALNIPCVCDQSDDILQTPEVQVLLSLLQVVDNPHQDIPLISVLASPVLGYTAEQVAQVRAGRRTGDFYDALRQDAAQRPDFRPFLTLLEQLRQQAQEQPVRTLLPSILAQTRLDAIFGAMEGGAQRLENLQTLLDLAAGFDPDGPGRLADFLRVIERQRERGIDGAGRQRPDAVHILSIHKSKGLEFPIVVLAGLSTKFNEQDARQPVQIHPELGAGCDVVDLRQRIRYPTIAKKAIILRAAQQSQSEELRVLYVALTRPKELLILSYATAGLAARLRALTDALDPAHPEPLARQAGSLGHWVLMAALCRPEAGELFALGGRPETLLSYETPWAIHAWSAADPVWRQPQAQSAAAAPVWQPDFAAAQAAIDFAYPHLAACQAPTKLTATQLKGRFLDEESAQQARVPVKTAPLRKPLFLQGKKPLSRTERGTAVHLAMQYIRYEACTDRDGVAQELARLVEQGFLLPEQAACVEPEKLVTLFRGPLGREILQAPQVVREFKFSLLVDAALYDPALADEELMLQGVTDCCLVKPDGLWVIDFKTDAVRPGQEDRTAQRYRGQLEAYSQALARIFQRPVQRKLLYFFATDCIFEL